MQPVSSTTAGTTAATKESQFGSPRESSTASAETLDFEEHVAALVGHAMDDEIYEKVKIDMLRSNASVGELLSEADGWSRAVPVSEPSAKLITGRAVAADL